MHQYTSTVPLLYTSLAVMQPAWPTRIFGAKLQVAHYFGFRSTKMTESPRRNILLMNRSLLTGVDPALPLELFGTCKPP